MLKVINDLLLATDAGKVSVACFLDLSAAFDVVDYDILLRRLSETFGIGCAALTWIESYLIRQSF